MLRSCLIRRATTSRRSSENKFRSDLQTDPLPESHGSNWRSGYAVLGLIFSADASRFDNSIRSNRTRRNRNGQESAKESQGRMFSSLDGTRSELAFELRQESDELSPLVPEKWVSQFADSDRVGLGMAAFLAQFTQSFPCPSSSRLLKIPIRIASRGCRSAYGPLCSTML